MASYRPNASHKTRASFDWICTRVTRYRLATGPPYSPLGMTSSLLEAVLFSVLKPLLTDIRYHPYLQLQNPLGV